MTELRDGSRPDATPLTPAQVKVIAVLASGGSLEEAAAAASVHRAG